MLRLTTEAGEALAFAKVGSSPVASALVRQETAALTRVADVGWQSIRAPRVLRVGELRGRALLVTSALAAAADVRQPWSCRWSRPGRSLAPARATTCRWPRPQSWRAVSGRPGAPLRRARRAGRSAARPRG
ncbi:MAG: hypothetical protein R2731_06325 [Nocardioides sp.]